MKRKKVFLKKRLTFVVGPREISKQRVKKLIEKYASESNYLIFGVLKEAFIPEMEFEQFRSLKLKDIVKVIEDLGGIGMGKIRILEYRHEDTQYVISELKPKKIVFIHGSFKRAIHLRSEFWKALDAKSEIIMESVFVDENEARNYEKKIKRRKGYKIAVDKFKLYSDKDLLELADKVSSHSFDWIYPIGAVLGINGKPEIIAHNTVLPFETYSALNGSIREIKHSPAGDQNHYDTNHAEMEILEQARRRRIGLRGKTLYLNVLPCPTCARVLSRTELSRIVYTQQYSDTYALKLLTESGIKMEQIV